VFLPQNTVHLPVNHGVFAVPARCLSRCHAAFSPPGARAIAEIASNPHFSAKELCIASD
jgi:hypothetical protein